LSKEGIKGGEEEDWISSAKQSNNSKERDGRGGILEREGEGRGMSGGSDPRYCKRPEPLASNFRV